MFKRFLPVNFKVFSRMKVIYQALHRFKIMVLQTAELDRIRWTKASSCCATGQRTRTTTSRRNLKKQFFERGVRFIRFWLGIACRMTRHFVNFVTYVAASGEPKAAPKPVPGPPSGDPPPGTCWAHVPSILTQDSSDFCFDCSQNTNWSGILKQGAWMQMSNGACAIKLVMKVYAHQVE